MTPIELKTFCNPLDISGEIPPSVTGNVCHDSRKVEPGDLFIAVDGYSTDGHQYIDQAIQNGASIILTEKAVEPQTGTCFMRVESTRKLLGPLALKFAGDPQQQLTLVGITGTNGKTTTATLVWQVLRKLGQKVSLLGTVSKKIIDRDEPSRLTTSDPVELANDLRIMKEAGSDYVVMEVSSHALVQQRVNGLNFAVASFTNLSQDHLDFHKSMDEYALAKKMLFEDLNEKSWAVTNADDAYGLWMIDQTKAKRISFSFENNGVITGKILKQDSLGSVLDIDETKFKTPMIGRFNAYNVANALLICSCIGFDTNAVADALEECKGAPGRMELVNPDSAKSNQPRVIVDYAHTPDALDNICHTLLELKSAEETFIVIFGCGGDRDKTKRPKMAGISEKYADEIIVTSDNPRTEHPADIINDILKGFSKRNSYTVIQNRKDAILKTVSEAAANSIILIAGKGHETYQEIHGKRHHFDDRKIAKEALEQRNGKPIAREVG